MRCTICNAYIPEGVERCLECGAGPEPEQVCQRCGTLVGARARFCRKCGAALAHAHGSSVETKRQSPAPTPARSAQPPCPRCGAYVPVGIKYCPACGINQDTVASKPENPPASAPAPPVQPVSVLADTSEATARTGNGKACPACGAEPRGTGRFCYACGRFLGTDVEDIICPVCGAACSLRYARCQYCGSELSAYGTARK